MGDKMKIPMLAVYFRQWCCITVVLLTLTTPSLLYATIESVVIDPSNPTDSDSISVRTAGHFGHSIFTLVDNPWQINANDIALDLLYESPFANTGALRGFSVDSDIGQLPAGNYTLSIRLIDRVIDVHPPYQEPWDFPDSVPEFFLNDTFSTNITVIPEPAGFGLFALAATLLGRRRVQIAH